MNARVQALFQVPGCSRFRGALNRIDFLPNPFNYWGANKSEGGLPSNDVRSIYQDKGRYLWVGTRGSGAVQLDRLSGEYTYFNEDNGLSHNVVYSLTGDKEDIWLGTSVGLNYYHNQDCREHDIFDSDDQKDVRY